MAGISVIIPSFNRCALLPRAIDSALQWFADGVLGEIVVVDDASTDGTVETLRQRYDSELRRGLISLHRLERNRGASGAKNTGAEKARYPWLVFLDSDDILIRESAPGVIAALERAGSAPVVFFRCYDMHSGQLIGEPQSSGAHVSLSEYLEHWRFGECLPAVSNHAFAKFPFLDALRGHEGIAYARMMAALGPAVVSPVVARQYETRGQDRLSTSLGRFTRGEAMSEGFSIIRTEFGGTLSAATRRKLLVREWVYRCAGSLHRRIFQ
jgi:glycosyltransferase involved in cell wall biosynthesis